MMNYGNYKSQKQTKGGISFTLGNAPKKYALQYYQFKVGHGAVGTFLVRIGVIKTPKCWWCGRQSKHLSIYMLANGENREKNSSES